MSPFWIRALHGAQAGMMVSWWMLAPGMGLSVSLAIDITFIDATFIDVTFPR